MSIFNTVKMPAIRRSAFDLSHTRKVSCNIGDIIPVFCQEILPGDSFSVNTEVFTRVAPLLAPIMDNLETYVHYFAVPHRLLWNEWEDFITGGEDGTLEPLMPVYTLDPSDWGSVAAPGTLADHFGVPSYTGSSTSLQKSVCALPFRAYQLIWNEYYRDQNLTPPIEFSLNSGVQPTSERNACLTMRQRCWGKDYFTSALPWAQRGPSVTLPLSGEAPVVYKPGVDNQGGLVRDVSGNMVGGNQNLVTNIGAFSSENTSGSKQWASYDPNGTLSVRLDGVPAITINDLRNSNAIQLWYEKNARGGSRYTEQIRAHFNVKPQDSRLQRPEYLGGGVSPLVVSEVLQTSSTVENSPLAQPAGKMAGFSTQNGFRKFFSEHCYVIGLMSVRPKSTYQQGMPRSLTRSEKFDYAFPELAHLGEQEIKNEEIYLNFENPTLNAGTFGYTPRYAEWKFIPSTVHGDFRTTLAFWHLGRIFEAAPGLSTEFVTCSAANFDRIFAVSDQGATDKLWCLINHNVKAIRPLPKFGTPRL